MKEVTHKIIKLHQTHRANYVYLENKGKDIRIYTECSHWIYFIFAIPILGNILAFVAFIYSMSYKKEFIDEREDAKEV